MFEKEKVKLAKHFNFSTLTYHVTSKNEWFQPQREKLWSCWQPVRTTMCQHFWSTAHPGGEALNIQWCSVDEVPAGPAAPQPEPWNHRKKVQDKGKNLPEEIAQLLLFDQSSHHWPPRSHLSKYSLWRLLKENSFLLVYPEMLGSGSLTCCGRPVATRSARTGNMQGLAPLAAQAHIPLSPCPRPHSCSI